MSETKQSIEVQEISEPSAVQIAAGVLSGKGGRWEVSGPLASKLSVQLPMDAYILVAGMAKVSGQNRMNVLRMVIDAGLESVMAEMDRRTVKHIVKVGHRELEPGIKRSAFQEVQK